MVPFDWIFSVWEKPVRDDLTGLIKLGSMPIFWKASSVIGSTWDSVATKVLLTRA